MPLMLQENFTVKLLEMLRTGEIDCAIMAEPFPDTGLAMAPLYDEPFMAAVPSSHPLAQKKTCPPRTSRTRPCCCWARATASATMCSRSAPSSRAMPAMPKASAAPSKARRWKPSSTWWPPAWA
jgi:DNA-binding transcriptional LysR family regulator